MKYHRDVAHEPQRTYLPSLYPSSFRLISPLPLPPITCEIGSLAVQHRGSSTLSTIYSVDCRVPCWTRSWAKRSQDEMCFPHQRPLSRKKMPNLCCSFSTCSSSNCGRDSFLLLYIPNFWPKYMDGTAFFKAHLWKGEGAFWRLHLACPRRLYMAPVKAVAVTSAF